MKNRIVSNLNNLLKKLFLLVSFTLSITSITPAFSQNSSTFVPKINNIPSSPEAALLGRFGDIPVGYYTGTANISIPIYTIKEAGVEIPITLRYHSSGIKVADEATWVGLGWDLSPGGEIIQEVRGKRDDEETEYHRLSNQVGYTDFKNKFGTLQSGDYNNRSQVGFAYNNCCGLYAESSNDDSHEIIMKLLENYGQPDIYNYNFAGYSGKFYINPENQQIVLIDKKEDITFEKNSLNNLWVATTLDGNTFYFRAVETAGGYGVSDYSGITFKLSSITFFNGKEINFSYVDETYTEIKSIENKVLFTVEPIGGGAETSYPMTWQNKKTLSKIISNEVVIDFNLDSREDFYGDVKKLKSIDITSTFTNQKIKSFEFGYSYFPYALLGLLYTGGLLDSYTALHETTLGKRLKLDFIKEIGYNNGVATTTKPSHQFEYNMNTTMPLKNSFSVDFWGYYNGENNDKLLPNLDYFDYPHDNRYKNLNSLLTYGYIGANRYTNNTYAGAYMLKKVIYPTGGFSEFEYEPNSFTNQFIPDKSKNVYKLNILQDDNQSGNMIARDFYLSKATTISFDNTITSLYDLNVPAKYFSRDEMIDCYIKLLKTDPNGGFPIVTEIKKWDLNSVTTSDFGTYGGQNWKAEDNQNQIRIEYDPNPNIFYTVKVYMPDNLISLNHISNVKSRFYYYDDTGVDISNSNQCGMRIKSIKNYTQTAVLASNKVIRYFEGKLLNKFEPLTVSNAQFNRCDISYVAGSTFIDDYVSYYNRIILSTDDFGVDGGNPVGYGKVEEVELDANNIDKGKNVFNYINEINQTKKGLPNIPNLKNGMINNESSYDKSGNILRETNYIYSPLSSTNISFGFKINNQSFGTTEICNLTSPKMLQEYIPYIEGYNHKYSFRTYPIISERNMLTKKETKEYFNGNAITTTEDYTYNDQGKTRSITTKNSNDEQFITKQYYSNDAISFNSTMTTMTGIPIYTEQYKESELLSAQKKEYTGSLLDSILTSKGNNILEKRVTYDLYDSKENLLQYTLESGTPVCIIWGYNQTLPVAKIENATYSQASAAYTTDDSAFRDSLPDAMITTYTYNPLIGVSTITDPKGDKITYTYDDLGRLLNVKDMDGNILSENEYHYKN